MYRKALLGLIVAGAFAIACGDDESSDGGGGTERGGNAGEGATSGRGGSSGTNEGGEPGTGGTNETGGTAGTQGGTAGTSGSAGEGGSDGGVPCEAGDPPQCADSETIMLCDPDADNTLQSFSCDDFCATLGLESGECVEDGADTTCDCGDPVDLECYAGAEEVCACLQGTDVECADDTDRFAWYLACVDGAAESEDIVLCFAENSAQACFRSIDLCVP